MDAPSTGDVISHLGTVSALTHTFTDTLTHTLSFLSLVQSLQYLSTDPILSM